MTDAAGAVDDYWRRQPRARRRLFASAGPLKKRLCNAATTQCLASSSDELGRAKISGWHAGEIAGELLGRHRSLNRLHLRAWYVDEAYFCCGFFARFCRRFIGGVGRAAARPTANNSADCIFWY